MNSSRQFFQFCFIGLINTCIHGIVYYSLLQLAVTLWVANTLGYFVAVIFSYYANACWTFQRPTCLIGFFSFFLGNSVCLLCVLCASWLGEYFTLSKNIVFLITAIISPLLNFLAHKKWTFKN